MKKITVDIEHRTYTIVEGYRIYSYITTNKQKAVECEDGKETVEEGYILLDDMDYAIYEKWGVMEPKEHERLFFTGIEEIMYEKREMESSIYIS